MLTLRDHILSSIIYTISILSSTASAVFGALILVRARDIIHQSIKTPLLILIIVQLIDLFSIPFYFFNLLIKTSICTFSILASLGSGLALIHYVLFTTSAIDLHAQSINRGLCLQLFITSYLVSLVFKSLALCFDLQFMEVDSIYEKDTESLSSLEITSNTQYNTDRQRFGEDQEHYISMKPSSMTLVDTLNFKNDPQVLADINKKPSMTSVGPIRNTTTITSSSNIVSGSSITKGTQRLPIISQSISRTNSDHLEGGVLMTTTSPTLDRFMKKKQSIEERKFGIERDAISRIPSALLPPHLRAAGPAVTASGTDLVKRSVSTGGVDSMFNNNWMLSTAYSNPDLAMVRSLYPSNGSVMADIPKGQPINAPVLDTVDHSVLRKLGKQDWQMNPVPFTTPNEQTQSCSEHSTTTTKSIVETIDAIDLPIKDDLTFSSESDGTDISINSGDKAALRYLNSARNSISEPMSSDFFQTAIMDSSTQLQLQNDPIVVVKTKSHSPHKSISFLKSHNQSNSMSSFTFGRTNSVSAASTSVSASAPGSPKRRSPTRRLGIKNLSLSSITFDTSEPHQQAAQYNEHHHQDQTDIPNLSYVHELQKSPSKTIALSSTSLISSGSTNTQQTTSLNQRRKSIHSKHPSMSKITEQEHVPNSSNNNNASSSPVKISLGLGIGLKMTPKKEQKQKQKHEQNTPESTHSKASSNTSSIFPSEVIGQYDREKWTTLERLNMIG